MADITIKDVESFGKVLKALGQLCEDKPGRLLNLIATNPVEPAEKATADGQHFAELRELDLFQLASAKDRVDLMADLQKYDVEQLRFLLRKYRFGSIKSKSPQVLLEHLVDQVLKRGVDVFKSHE